jgi:hypothetical protein
MGGRTSSDVGREEQVVTPAIPPRLPAAPTGSAFLSATRKASLDEREKLLVAEILAGSVPDFLRAFVDVPMSSASHRAVVHVLPDYLALGRDDDFFRAPLRPAASQEIATAFGCLLPTRKTVLAVFAAGTRVGFRGQRKRAACVDMACNECFAQFHRAVEAGRQAVGAPLGALVAGHMKDVIVSNAIHRRVVHGRRPVMIFGAWYAGEKDPIQPAVPVHDDRYVDYSHGARLVSGTVTVDGVERPLDEALADPSLLGLFADALIPDPRYPR